MGLWDVQVGFLRRCASRAVRIVEEHREAHASEWAVLTILLTNLSTCAFLIR